MTVGKFQFAEDLIRVDRMMPLSISYIIASFARADVNKTQQKTTKQSMFEILKSPGSVFNNLRGYGMKMAPLARGVSGPGGSKPMEPTVYIPPFFPTPCMSLQTLASQRADRRQQERNITQQNTTKHTTIRNNTQLF